MRYPFSKYHGAGNDFILMDHRQLLFPFENRALIQKLCNRQKGIGADGIILIENSSIADFHIRIFNCDGSQAEMCGNGLRCVKQFLAQIGHSAPTYRIQAGNGIFCATTEGERISTLFSQPTIIQWGCHFHAGGEALQADWIDTGVPHAVLFVENLDKVDVAGLGSQIRLHPLFRPKGVNVNFVQIAAPGVIKIRTFERGVEAETLACGTGAAASAIGYAKRHPSPGKQIQVHVRSGDCLDIRYECAHDDTFKEVCLLGPATEIFRGEVEI